MFIALRFPGFGIIPSQGSGKHAPNPTLPEHILAVYYQVLDESKGILMLIGPLTTFSLPGDANKQDLSGVT